MPEKAQIRYTMRIATTGQACPPPTTVVGQNLQSVAFEDCLVRVHRRLYRAETRSLTRIQYSEFLAVVSNREKAITALDGRLLALGGQRKAR